MEVDVQEMTAVQVREVRVGYHLRKVRCIDFEDLRTIYNQINGGVFFQRSVRFDWVSKFFFSSNSIVFISVDFKEIPRFNVTWHVGGPLGSFRWAGCVQGDRVGGVGHLVVEVGQGVLGGGN